VCCDEHIHIRYWVAVADIAVGRIDLAAAGIATGRTDMLAAVTDILLLAVGYLTAGRMAVVVAAAEIATVVAGMVVVRRSV
jgi:hypothetical protein